MTFGDNVGPDLHFSSKSISDHLVHSCVTSSNETDEKVWEEVKNALRPGGHLAVVIKMEDHHKVMVAIEDAGFEIRDAVACLVDSDSFENFERNYYMTVLARKPLSEDNVAQNVLKHETAAINIDDCRLDYDGPVKRSSRESDGSEYYDGNSNWQERGRKPNRPSTPTDKGRWPTNLILDNESSKELDFQSGKLSSGENAVRTKDASDSYHGGDTGAFSEGAVMTTYGDSGGASRYFYTPKDFSEEFENSDLVGLMCYLIRLLTPEDGVVFDPFLSTSSVGVSAILEDRKFIGNGEESSHPDIKFAAENASQLREKYTSKEKQKNDKDSTVEHNFWD